MSAAEAERGRGCVQLTGASAGGGQALEVQADLADESSVKGMFDTVEGHFGPVLIPVNNAGIRQPETKRRVEG